MVYDLDGNLIGDISFIEPRRYRILQYNMGQFTGNGYASNDLSEYIPRWLSFLGSTNSDICLLTGVRPWIDTDTSIPTNNILERIYNHLSGDSNYGSRILTNQFQGFGAARQKYFENQLSNNNGINANVCIQQINLNSTNILIFVISLTSGDSSEAISIRASQMEELCDLISAYCEQVNSSNIIVGGDFNIQTIDELTPLLDSDLHFTGSGELFGNCNTYPQSAPNLPFNNICIAGSHIKLQSFKILTDCTLSDYCPIIADIIVEPMMVSYDDSKIK